MRSGLDDGFGAPYVKVFYKDHELTTKVVDFDYGYDEEGDDVCKMEFKFDNREEADEPQWQEKAELVVIWGFINGETCSRKVYVQQLKWEFEKENITLKVDATEKAISLKYEDSQEVYQNTSLLGVAQRLAYKHNLQLFLEQDAEKTPDYIAPTLPGEHLNKYLLRNHDAVVRRNVTNIKDFPEKIDQSEKNRIKVTGVLTNAMDQTATYKKKNKLTSLVAVPDTTDKPITKEYSDFLDKASKDYDAWVKNLSNKFNNYDSIPQANKTDKQILDELGKKEKDGPYLIDTRDDSITIKKRDFNQVPYKAYNYGGDEGSLVEFAPMTKNKGHKRGATNVGFSGWNALDKTAFTGNANGVPDADPSISRFRKVYQFYKGLDVAGKGAEGLEDNRGRKFSMNITNPTQNPFYSNKIDNTSTGIHPMLITPYTVHDAVAAMEGALKNVYNKLTNNSVYDPEATDPQSAYNAANNLRRNKELSMNPATALIYGDPNLKTGLLITILSVSKKYSGNYYILKANHKISPKSGYMVELELCTHGYNISPNDEYILSDKVNKKIGGRNGRRTKIKLTYTKNP